MAKARKSGKKKLAARKRPIKDMSASGAKSVKGGALKRPAPVVVKV